MMVRKEEKNVVFVRLLLLLLTFIYIYIALFCARDDTHCAHVACGSQRMIVVFYSAFLNIHRGGELSAVWLLHGCST